MTKTTGNLILMTVICIVIFWIVMALRPANAWPQPGPNLSPQGIPYVFSPRTGYIGPPVAVHNGFRNPYPMVYPRTGGVSIPVPPLAYAEPLPPPPEPTPLPPPPPAEALPPPPAPAPLGWIYGPYTICLDPPGCSQVIVSVGADGLNVRTVPNGPVVAALANGTPVIPLQQDGRWVLVAPACALMPTYTFSVTAGGVPLSVCAG
jgi:hypothetical protein